MGPPWQAHTRTNARAHTYMRTHRPEPEVNLALVGIVEIARENAETEKPKDTKR